MLPILRQLDLIILVLIRERGQVVGGNCRGRRNVAATHGKSRIIQEKNRKLSNFIFAQKFYVSHEKPKAADWIARTIRLDRHHR